MKHFIVFILFLLSFKSNAQLDTTFWFVAPEVAQNHGDRPIVFRFATLANPATITVSQPANPTFPVQVINLAANSAQTLDLTTWIDITENKPANTILNFGFKITATAQITAYYEVTPTCNCNPDIFSLKGKNSLGTAFLTPFQNFLNNASYARSGFNIVATEDNTTITIVPSQNIVGHAAGIPFTITLNEGQTYCAEASSTAANLHLSGSSVVSNKKIAITLHDDTAQGTPYGGCADLQGDQLIPMTIIGMEYIALKGYLNGPDKVYILGTSNGTSLTIDGLNVGTINLGQTYVHTLSNPSAYIVASDSVYVLHQSGFGCEVGEAVLPPLICTGSNVVPFTRSTNEFFAVNILVPAGGETNFTYNGLGGVINPANFNFVPGTSNAWMYAQLDMSATVPVQQGSRIENNTVKFHMGIIHGGASSGCRFGYFSDFASLRYEIQSANDTYCAGETIQLTSIELPGATYTWNGPNNFSQVGSTISISNAQLADSGLYIVSGQLPDACVLLPDTIQITIINQPSIPEIFHNGPWCANESGMIWHNIPSMLGYQWTDENGTVLTQNDTLYFASFSNQTSISVSLTANLNSCISGNANESISIFELPSVSANSPFETCGSEINLNSTVQNANGDLIDSVYWYSITDNSYIGNGSSIQNYLSPLVPESNLLISVNVVSDNGCFNSDTAEYFFHAIPNLSATSNDLCNGEDVLISIQNNWIGNPSPSDAISGVINFGDGTTQLNPAWNFIKTYASPGNYIVTYPVQSIYGCLDTLVFAVSLHAIPAVSIEITPKCVEKADVTASIQGGNFQLDSLLWNFTGFTTSNQLTSEQSFPGGGEVTGDLTIWSNVGCEYEFAFQFEIEPSIDFLTLEIPNVITANNDGINDKIIINPLFENCFSYELTILNRWGTKLFTSTSSTQPFEGKDQNGNELVSGVYFYTLSSNQGEKHGFITIIK
jgi:gliding motility-associated-like protein